MQIRYHFIINLMLNFIFELFFVLKLPVNNNNF